MNNSIVSQLASQNTIEINGICVQQDRFGRYCINDLHKASGSERKHQPQYFLDNKQTQGLVDALIDTGIPVSPVEVIRGGLNQGTYVAKELVYAYAMWINPVFHLKVIKTFDSLVQSNNQAPQLPNFADPVAAARAWENEVEAKQLAQQQVAVLEPKAQALDAIADTTNTFCLRDAAKTIGVPERKFIQFLLDKRWIYRKNDRYNSLSAYSTTCDKKVMVNKVTRIIETDEGKKVYTQPRVTAFGLTRLAAMVEKAGLMRGKAA